MSTMSGSISQKRRGFLDFHAENRCNLSSAFVIALLLLSFSMGPTLGVKYDLILALRSQIFEYFGRNVLQTCLGVPRTGSFRKKKVSNLFSLRKRLTVNDLFEGTCLIGTHFRRWRPP